MTEKSFPVATSCGPNCHFTEEFKSTTLTTTSKPTIFSDQHHSSLVYHPLGGTGACSPISSIASCKSFSKLWRGATTALMCCATHSSTVAWGYSRAISCFTSSALGSTAWSNLWAGEVGKEGAQQVRVPQRCRTKLLLTNYQSASGPSNRQCKSSTLFQCHAYVLFIAPEEWTMNKVMLTVSSSSLLIWKSHNHADFYLNTNRTIWVSEILMVAKLAYVITWICICCAMSGFVIFLSLWYGVNQPRTYLWKNISYRVIQISQIITE